MNPVSEPFLANAPIPQPLRIPGNQGCNFCFPQVDIMGTMAINGLDKSIIKYANAYIYILIPIIYIMLR